MPNTPPSTKLGIRSTAGGLIILAISAYHVLSPRFPVWVRELLAVLAWAVGLLVVGLILQAIAQTIFSTATASRIRRWHAGQLVIFWLATILVACLMGALREAIPYSRTHYQQVECPITQCGSVPNALEATLPYTKQVEVNEPHPTGDQIQRASGILLALGTPAILLAVTWVWFGGRPPRGHRDE